MPVQPANQRRQHPARQQDFEHEIGTQVVERAFEPSLHGANLKHSGNRRVSALGRPISPETPARRLATKKTRESRIIQRMQACHVKVANDLGLHARLAARIVYLASRFSSSVSLAFNGRTANARNVLAVMLLAASVGGTILIEASGPDETEAIDALSSLIGGRAN